jgi:hypothetical protein
MAIAVTPTGFSIEKWMRVDGVGGATLFMFSGFAEFGPKVGDDPLLNTSLVGQGDDDTKEQLDYVEYDITDLIVGPHWTAVRGICPSVWAAGHDQAAPDNADGMGYQVTAIKKVNVVNQGTFSRIELQVSCKVAGGFDTSHTAWGRIPALAYRVSALGKLAASPGNEGVFFGNPAF